MIRSIALVSVTVAAGTMFGVGSALAADLPPPPSKSAPVYPPPQRWSGCYLGGNIGAGWDSTHTD
jgi:hypothetical protein